MDFGQMVRELRTRNGLTQDELATRLDLSPAAIGAWENGRAKPRLGKIHELADLFDVTVSELMGESSHLDAVGGPSVPVPLVATSHMGDAADDEEPDRVVRFPLEVVERHPGCFAVRAEGGCMDKRYVSGSVLLIDPHMQPKCFRFCKVGFAHQAHLFTFGNVTSTTSRTAIKSHLGYLQDIKTPCFRHKKPPRPKAGRLL